MLLLMRFKLHEVWEAVLRWQGAREGLPLQIEELQLLDLGRGFENILDCSCMRHMGS